MNFKTKIAFIRFLLVITLPVAAYAQGGVVGSAHDFSSQIWSGGEVCKVCHTPHNATLALNTKPLWNHQITSATFNIYQSSTMQGQPEQPRGSSKLCLSCHDGTVAIDSFGGNSGSHILSGAAMLGTDLRDDHPISVSWSHPDRNHWTPSCVSCHESLTGTSTWGPVFPDGYVECISCHEIHKNPTGSHPKLLRFSNDGSQFCQMCHAK